MTKLKTYLIIRISQDQAVDGKRETVGALAEFERDLIQERTNAGMEGEIERRFYNNAQTLDSMWTQGETPYAFSFKKPFPAPEEGNELRIHVVVE